LDHKLKIIEKSVSRKDAKAQRKIIEFTYFWRFCGLARGSFLLFFEKEFDHITIHPYNPPEFKANLTGGNHKWI